MLRLILGQLLVGLINGSFYAMIVSGSRSIFGLLGIANIAQGAFYMMGAFFSWMLLRWAGIGYFPSLILVPLAVGAIGMVIETPAAAAHLSPRSHVRAAADVRHSDVHPGTVRVAVCDGWTSLSRAAELRRRVRSRLHVHAEISRLGGRGVADILCFATWFVIEKTPLGRTLRAATENPRLTRAFGVNVPALDDLGFGVGVALAGAAGVFAAPIYRSAR